MGGELARNVFDRLARHAADFGVLVHGVRESAVLEVEERGADLDAVHFALEVDEAALGIGVQGRLVLLGVHDHVIGRLGLRCGIGLRLGEPCVRGGHELAVVRGGLVVDDEEGCARVGGETAGDGGLVVGESQVIGVVGLVLDNPAGHAEGQLAVRGGLNGVPGDALGARRAAAIAEHGVEDVHLRAMLLQVDQNVTCNFLEALAVSSRCGAQPQNIFGV